MSVIKPELEIVNNPTSSIRYLEHGWPSELCRWHFHAEYELHLIVKTKGTVFIGDYIGPFQAGSLFLVGPYVPHNWISQSSNPKDNPKDIALRDMLFQFHGDHFNTSIYPEFHELQTLFQLSLSGIEFTGFNAKKAQRRLAEIRDSQGLKRIILAFDFLDVLNKWPHKRTLSLSHINQAINIKKHHNITTVVNYIVENYAEDITLKLVASMAGYSESAFSRHFHTSTGNRFSEFLNRVRIGKACIMLYQSTQSISSISYEVGFQNLSNFNRQFFKLKQQTPTEYRKKAQKELTTVT